MSRGRVAIFTDGSAWEGRGGFAAVIVRRHRLHLLAGPIGGSCTNQQAEMLAVISGLVLVRPLPALDRPVTVYSDSAYVVNCWQQGWISNWRRKGWKNSSGKPVANRELWESMEAAVDLHATTFVHMRGHGRGNEDPRWVAYNARADRLASAARAEGLSVNRTIERRPA